MRSRNHGKNKTIKFLNINSKHEKEEIQKRKLKSRLKIIYDENVIDLAINNYNKDNEDKKINFSTNTNTLNRILLNYIRHNKTNYDQVIRTLSKTNSDLIKFKIYVNELISIKYVDVFVKLEMIRYLN